MKQFFLLFFSLSLFGSEFQTIVDEAKTPILTPQLKNRKVEKIRLNNGLEAVLVSDPLIKESAALLTVEAGSWQDKEEAPGLAHFLEHMLFLGTEKYPEESGYQKFIAEHGGETNAYTASDHTSYMFSVHNDGFIEALDRFANFFIAPLFSPSGVSREIKAIDQEFAKGFNSEDTRQFHVVKYLVDPKHPFHRFNTGNNKTLSSVTRETLKNWYLENYSASKMHLYVLSPLKIEELRALVVEDFSKIPNRETPPLNVPLQAIPNNRLGEIVYIESKNNSKTLSALFEMPKDDYNKLNSKPEDLISYVLGHEGKESLLAELKREGLAEGVTTGKIDLNDQLSFLLVEISLTKKGLKEPTLVLERLFQAIKRLQETPFPKELFDEYQALMKQKYQFQQVDTPFNTVMNLASSLNREPINTFPEKTNMIFELDTDSLKKVLNVLKPALGLYLIASPTLPAGLKTEIEPWMGVKFSEEPLSQSILERLSNVSPHEAITLTEPNPFVVKGDLVLPKDEPSKDQYPFQEAPKAIVDSQSTICYYNKDSLYQLPRSWLRFKIESPEIKEGNPMASALTDIFVTGLKDTLSEIIYDGKVADLSVAIEHKTSSIDLTLEGYTESLNKFFPPFLDQLMIAPPSEEKFIIWKESVLKEYENEKNEMPLFQTIDYFKKEIFKKFSQKQEKRNALNKITYETFLNFQKKVFQKTSLKALLTGSLSEAEALYFIHLIEKKLSPSFPFKESNIEVTPLSNEAPLMIQAKVPAEGNGMLLAIEVPEFSPFSRNCQQLLEMSLQQEFYGELRTRQQTGYMVMSFSNDFYKNLFTFFGIQSNTYQPIELLFRTELFLELYLLQLTTVHITPETFEKLKSTLITKLKEPPKNLPLLGEQQFKLAFEIEDFAWMGRRLKALEALSYDEFISFTKKFLGRENRRRIGILLRGKISEENRFEYKEKSTKREKKSSLKEENEEIAAGKEVETRRGAKTTGRKGATGRSNKSPRTKRG